MAVSTEMRLLGNKWQAGRHWPKRLEWLEIRGLRGWRGQRITFPFPIVAVCGENGSGKSTVLQAAASIYAQPRGRVSPRYRWASDFLPDTPWDRIQDASIRGQVKQGGEYPQPTRISKKTERWRGNPDRPKRWVEYIDLSRTQPVSARTGYKQIAKPNVVEKEARELDHSIRKRLVEIKGTPYTNAKIAHTDADPKRRVPVVALQGSSISGFHQGAGELTVTELLEVEPQQYGLLLIDEIETSLHPRAQRRLIRDLADLCKERELQIILTTHSPYILAELPPEGRIYIMEREGEREIMVGVSPDFAMSKMDDMSHPECDVYVEDERAQDLLREILVLYAPDEVARCQFVRYGAASVGFSLGGMVAKRAFPRASVVFVDGDQAPAEGCLQLPGGDAPERVVFGGLSERNWGDLKSRLGRNFADIADACSRAMLIADHKQWLVDAGSKLLVKTDVLWPLMCQEWARLCLDPGEAKTLADAVRDALENYPNSQVPGPPKGTVVPPSQPWPQLPSRPQEADGNAAAAQEDDVQRKLFSP